MPSAQVTAPFLQSVIAQVEPAAQRATQLPEPEQVT
jgi:hypothetical protein